MKSIKFFLLAFFFFSFSANSLLGQWTEITNFNQVVSDLLVFEGDLFVCGGFTEREDKTSFRSTQYNGNSFDDNTSVFAGTGLRDMVIFDNEIYAVGGQGIYVWTGSSWGNNPSNSKSGLHVEGNTIYIGGDFGIAQYMEIGGNWTALPELEGFSQTIQAITVFDGDIIVAGRFENFGATVLNGVARWTGSTWEPLGEGISGGFSGSEVRTVAIYNGEMYLGGSFSGAGGQTIKNIAKWNGSAWSDVGGSNTGSGSNGVRDMTIHNGELYVCGDFSEMGGVAAKYVAKWNGSSWTGLSLNESENYPECIGFYKNELFVGTFDFELAHLYKAGFNTATSSIAKDIGMEVYPNPTSAVINFVLPFELEKEVTKIEIFDSAGKIIETLEGGTKSLSCVNWAKGIYFVALKDENNQQLQVERFIVN